MKPLCSHVSSELAENCEIESLPLSTICSRLDAITRLTEATLSTFAEVLAIPALDSNLNLYIKGEKLRKLTEECAAGLLVDFRKCRNSRLMALAEEISELACLADDYRCRCFVVEVKDRCAIEMHAELDRILANDLQREHLAVQNVVQYSTPELELEEILNFGTDEALLHPYFEEEKPATHRETYTLNISADSSSLQHVVSSRVSQGEHELTEEQLAQVLSGGMEVSTRSSTVSGTNIRFYCLEPTCDDKVKLCCLSRTVVDQDRPDDEHGNRQVFPVLEPPPGLPGVELNRAGNRFRPAGNFGLNQIGDNRGLGNRNQNYPVPPQPPMNFNFPIPPPPGIGGQNPPNYHGPYRAAANPFENHDPYLQQNRLAQNFGIANHEFEIGLLNTDTFDFKVIFKVTWPIYRIIEYKDLYLCLDITFSKLQIVNKEGFVVKNMVFEYLGNTQTQRNGIIQPKAKLIGDFCFVLTSLGEVTRVSLCNDFEQDPFVGNTLAVSIEISDRWLFILTSEGSIVKVDPVRLTFTKIPRGDVKNEEKPKPVGLAGATKKPPTSFYNMLIDKKSLLVFSRMQREKDQSFGEMVSLYRVKQNGEVYFVKNTELTIEGFLFAFDKHLVTRVDGIRHLVLSMTHQAGLVLVYTFERDSFWLRKIVKVADQKGQLPNTERRILVEGSKNQVLLAASNKSQVTVASFKLIN